jgi:uncharacterized protein
MTTEKSSLSIWVDADACPKAIKEILFKTSFRLKIPTCLVANSYMPYPPGGVISSIQVDQGDDVADFYIVKHVKEKDIVITADIPLAALVVEKGALALNPRGELYDEENVQERLSMRDFMKDLRDSGVETGGPAPFGPKDKERFSNTLNRLLSKIKKT